MYRSLNDFLKREFKIDIEYVIEASRCSQDELREDRQITKEIRTGTYTLMDYAFIDFINRFIIWPNTPEGLDYWRKIYFSLRAAVAKNLFEKTYEGRYLLNYREPVSIG